MNNNTPLPFPKELTPIPQAPKGYRWEYRGINWVAKNVIYACHSLYTMSSPWETANNMKPSSTMGADMHYAELVRDVPINKTATFIVRTWKEWVDNIYKNLQEQLNEGKITVQDIVESNQLDPEDPSKFLSSWMFMDVFEEKVFVKHATAKDCYWYIRLDRAKLVDYPQHS